MKFRNYHVNQCFCLFENLNIQFMPNASLFSCQSIVSLFPQIFLTVSLHCWFHGMGSTFSMCFHKHPHTHADIWTLWTDRVVVSVGCFLVWPCLEKSWWLVKQHNLDSLQQGKKNHIYVANASFCAIFSIKIRYKQGRTAVWHDMAYVNDTTVLPFTHAVK